MGAYSIQLAYSLSAFNQFISSNFNSSPSFLSTSDYEWIQETQRFTVHATDTNVGTNVESCE